MNTEKKSAPIDKAPELWRMLDKAPTAFTLKERRTVRDKWPGRNTARYFGPMALAVSKAMTKLQP